MTGRLTGKVAIVTGAGSGMGKAISQLFAKEGAKVALADINAQGIEEVKQAIEQAGGQAAAKVTNVVKQEDVDGVIDFATQTFGQLDILANNAGIMDNFTPVGNLTDAEYERVMAINLTGSVKLCRVAIQVMEKQETGGVIINNASVGGLFGTRGGAAYTMAKHALVGLTKNIAGTYGRFGKVRANAIAPGGVATNIQTTITAPDPLGMQALQATGETPIGQPGQIANLALFLASDEASFINGDIVKADGGWTVN